MVDDTVYYEAKPDTDFVITRGDDASYIISGSRIEKLVAMTNLDDEQALRRFQKILALHGFRCGIEKNVASKMAMK